MLATRRAPRDDTNHKDSEMVHGILAGLAADAGCRLFLFTAVCVCINHQDIQFKIKIIELLLL